MERRQALDAARQRQHWNGAACGTENLLLVGEVFLTLQLVMDLLTIAAYAQQLATLLSQLGAELNRHDAKDLLALKSEVLSVQSNFTLWLNQYTVLTPDASLDDALGVSQDRSKPPYWLRLSICRNLQDASSNFITGKYQ
jgi:hypothetical protein